MPKLTLEQKRLETLRQQLSGSTPQIKSSPGKSGNTFSFNPTEVVANIHSSQADLSTTSYLRKDLLKIFVLSGLAIAVQLVLFYASKSNLLRIP